MSWTIVVAACLGLVLPTANYAIFDGLPLSTVPEAGAATLLLAVIVSRSLRQGAFARLTGRVSVTRVLVGLASAVIVGKTVLLLSGTALGLPGCYTTPLGSPANGKCEVSYENPGFDYGATRVDRAIAFGERDWNLSFVNSSRFNYYSSVRGNRRRDRLPLAVTWLGRLDSPRDVTLELTYVGEGRLGVGKAQVELAPSYDGKEVVKVSLPPGRQLISLVYRFDDHSAVGSRVRGPYGLLSLRFLDDHGRTADVTLSPDRPPRTSHRVVALVSDLALLVVVGALGISILLTAKIAIPLALLALAVAVGIARCDLGGHAVYLLHWGFAATLLAALIARPTPGLLAACLPLASVPVLGRLTLTLPHPGSVLYRQAGNDWLTYESFARTILETGSLQAGEPVFYYQPFSRYVVFAGHFLLGDGDLLPASLFTTLGVVAVLYALSEIARGCSGPRRAGILAVGLVLLAIVVSPSVVGFFTLGASEGPTWIFVPFALTLAFLGSSRRSWIAASCLLALAAITRFNQLPVLALFLVASLFAAPRARRWDVLPWGAALFCATLLLPLAHNLHYGGRPVLTTTSAGIQQNLVIAPESVLAVLEDQQLRERVERQLGFLASLHPAALAHLERTGVLLPFRALQLAWVLALAWAAWRRSFYALLVLGVPAAYFLIHVFYQVEVYYPRHLVVGYLMIAWTICWSIAQHPQTVAPQPVTAPQSPLVQAPGEDAGAAGARGGCQSGFLDGRPV